MLESLTTFREIIGGVIAPTLIEKRNKALRAAETDALTGLGNRAAFDKAEPQAIAERKAFIVFDANNFGKINKQVSYAQGDGLLKDFASIIAGVCKMYKARAFRLGGDEFAIITSAPLAESVRDSVERRIAPVRFPGFEVSISGEIGYSLADADSRLQRRKAERKNR